MTVDLVAKSNNNTDHAWVAAVIQVIQSLLSTAAVSSLSGRVCKCPARRERTERGDSLASPIASRRDTRLKEVKVRQERLCDCKHSLETIDFSRVTAAQAK